MLNVLLVEDDPLLGKAIMQGLREAGNDCTWAKTGPDGLELALQQKADVLVLDLLLPGLPGIALLSRLREHGVQTPVLILTALGSVDERVEGLRAGADDYLVKPFAFAELLARLAAVTRRSQKLNSHHLECGPLKLDLSTRKVIRDNQEINLTPTEFSLLEFLMRNAGQVVTRKMLCEHLWEANWEGVTNVIEVHVNRLRSKIDREFEFPLLQTVRGRGYVLRGSDIHS